MPMIGARFYAQIDNLHVRGDILENELAKVSQILINSAVGMHQSQLTRTGAYLFSSVTYPAGDAHV